MQSDPEFGQLEARVLEACRGGNMIEGIKAYRDAYHVDLASAKTAVEAIMHRAGM